MNWYKLKVFRYDPSIDQEPKYETFQIPASEKMWVLDALIYIRENYDSSLAFRYSCRHPKKCGSCGLTVNGEPRLACMTLLTDGMTIEPLSCFPVIRDLVTDTSQFERNIVKLDPFLETIKKPEKVPWVFLHNRYFQQTSFFDICSCIECYLCVGACPIATKWTIGPVGHVTLARFALDPRDAGTKPRRAYAEGVYSCTACNRCMEVCPQEIAIPEIVIQRVRTLCLEKGYVPSTMKPALDGVRKYGNPWGLSRSKRSNWTVDLDVKLVSKRQKAELLYFVGCAASYDARAQNVAKSFIKNLKTLKIDCRILGNNEICCGNEIYTMGEEGLFEMVMEENLRLFKSYGVERIVSTSPHCFNAFKNRYREELQVQHYTEFFANLTDQGNLGFSKRLNKVITYHDSCYLGRYNNIYEEPRKILESIPGVRFREMRKSMERSVCCEGGGGRMWHEVPGERLAETRIKEAIDIEADIIAVACPFCLMTLNDAVKTLDKEDSIQVMDIMELVAVTL